MVENLFMQKDTNDWFATWFDSAYYHILYKNRDEQEAARFMNVLTAFLKLAPNSRILDLACGKGRHAQYLNSLGFDVIGVDLSPKSIEFAKQFENDTLIFKVHDMRLPFQQKFDAVFNLFTSFGYFENEEDNLKALKAMKQALKPNGIGVIDFLNVNYVKKHLKKAETKIIDGITFHIRKKIENGFILKNIKFKHNGEQYNFTERVKAIDYPTFIKYFEKTKIELLHSIGDYQLHSFSESNSERLILVFK